MANLEEENASPLGQPIDESNLDEILRLIKKSDYKVVDQLLQTPSKISILSLLMSSEAHRKVLMKILEQAYVDHEVSVDQFDGIVSNITACNNLALHISVHCGSDMISNVLVDTGSSLNVMPESTLRQLSHHGISLRGSSYLVKAFDGSRKDVLGEVDLPITVGPETFLQGLTVEGAEPRRAGASMASLKDAQKAVQAGQAAGWGKVIQILENMRKEGLGFSPTSGVSKGTFYSAGFINAIAEDASERNHVPTFVIPGGTVRNWEAIDVPLVMHASM